MTYCDLLYGFLKQQKPPPIGNAHVYGVKMCSVKSFIELRIPYFLHVFICNYMFNKLSLL